MSGRASQGPSGIVAASRTSTAYRMRASDSFMGERDHDHTHLLSRRFTVKPGIVALLRPSALSRRIKRWPRVSQSHSPSNPFTNSNVLRAVVILVADAAARAVGSARHSREGGVRVLGVSVFGTLFREDGNMKGQRRSCPFLDVLEFERVIRRERLTERPTRYCSSPPIYLLGPYGPGRSGRLHLFRLLKVDSMGYWGDKVVLLAALVDVGVAVLLKLFEGTAESWTSRCTEYLAIGKDVNRRNFHPDLEVTASSTLPIGTRVVRRRYYVGLVVQRLRIAGTDLVWYIFHGKARPRDGETKPFILRTGC
ncbi:hypothetical protein C8R43DRAFT_1118183 [Mycena crocata]|nr:hypothetical protein C8R43DRAFT_1118183 [Mycena crocata]